MRVINIVGKFLIIPEIGSFRIQDGDVKIFGLDDASSALMQTEFEELTPANEAGASSSSSSSNILRSSYSGEIDLDEALSKITEYLNALDQQEFTVVSAFKDKLPAGPGQKTGYYKMFVWTMQK